MAAPQHDASEPTAEVLIASNRGPVSYSRAENGTLSAKRGGGGVVSGLSAIGPDTDAVWVCAALSDGDRAAVEASHGGHLDPADSGGRRVHMLGIDPRTHADAYNGIANSVLWFIHHLLYQTPFEPAFGNDFRAQWAGYLDYNTAFADALAQEAGHKAAVLVQDYHLTLTPRLLRERRPDLRIGHFSHTPWAPPDYFRLLPDDVAADVLRGVLGADRAGFLTRRWARSFADCAEQILGARVTEENGELSVAHEGGTTRLGVHGLGADAEFLRERGHRADVAERMAALRERVGPDRKVIVRVDRTELSKNIVRGLQAYDLLLTDHPEWRGRVVHVAFAYPSRYDLAVYRDYTETVQRVAEDLNARHGTPGWQPLILHVEDDFARSLAAYRIADVALVNPIRDGMNLVAKEIPVLSDDGCALVLSREAGAYEELGADAIGVNPYDINATAAALHTALSMPDGERAARTGRLAAAATALPPSRWFLDQLEALGG